MDSLWTEWTEWGLIFIVGGPADWQWLSSSVARREVNQLPSWFNLKVRKNDRAKARTTDTSKFSQKKFSRDKSPLIRRNKRYQFAKGFSSAHWTKPGFDKAFYSFFFSLFFFREMKKRVWRWSRVSIKISRSLGCWRGGGMPRKEFISETREWQCARSRQSSIEPLSRTVACTGDELCSPLHESREDRGVFWTWLAHRRHQQLLLTAPRRRFSREHGEHLPLSRTPAAHFLDNARIIVYEAAYNSIDRHFIHLSLSLTHTQTHTGARALLCDSPSIVFLLSYGSQCLAIFHTMSISRFKILCIL